MKWILDLKNKSKHTKGHKAGGDINIHGLDPQVVMDKLIDITSKIAIVHSDVNILKEKQELMEQEQREIKERLVKHSNSSKLFKAKVNKKFKIIEEALTEYFKGKK